MILKLNTVQAAHMQMLMPCHEDLVIKKIAVTVAGQNKNVSLK
jgi:hypothetical protein